MKNFNNALFRNFKKNAVDKVVSVITISLTTAFAAACLAGQANAANLVVNPGFENNPPSNMGNNYPWPITPWIVTGAGQPNVVRVDGPGGYDYFSNGPESDGTAPGAGVPQHYLDIANNGNNFYQSFTVPACPASPTGTTVTVQFSGKFSTRAFNVGYNSGTVANGKVELLSGTGTGGSVIASLTAPLTAAAPSKFAPWVLVSGTATVVRGSTFSYVVTMNDNVNFDDAVVIVDADPCDPSPKSGGTLNVTKEALYNGNHITGQSFPIAVTCGSTVTNATVADGTPYQLSNIPVGQSCSVVEGTGQTASNICTKGTTPKWTTSYNPTGPVTVTESGSTINIRNVLECVPPVDPPTDDPKQQSCLSGKTDVVCGKTPGTYTVTLHPSGAGGVIPTSVSIVPPAGITLVPNKPSYPVNGGAVSVTLAGATPGQSVVLQVQGKTSGAGSQPGTELCCNGEIKVDIPKDMPCDNDKFDIAIKKTGATSPPLDVPWYYFDLAMTNEGKAFTAAAGQLSVVEHVPAGMKFTTITPSAGWSCAPAAPITGPADLVCTYAGGALPAGPGTSIGGVNIVAQNMNPKPYAPVKNCADIGLLSTTDSNPENDTSCVTVEKPKDPPPGGDGSISVKKICDPAQQGPAGGWEAKCHITVTSTGNISGPISVSEVFTPLATGSAGTVTYTGSSTGDPWTCPALAIPSGSPLTCTLPASTLNPAGDSSTLDVVVKFTGQGWIQESKNCATATFGGQQTPQSCTNFSTSTPPSMTVKKTCGAAAVVPGSNQFQAQCYITVTTSGPQSGVVAMGDILTGGGGTLGPITNTSTPAWTCPSGQSNCTIAGSSLNQNASSSTFTVPVTFSSQGDVANAQNCAQLGVNGNQAAPQSCATFSTTPPIDLAIKKTGQPNSNTLGDNPHFDFTIVVTNEGNAFTPGLNQVTVTEQVPAGVTVQSVSATNLTTCVPLSPIVGPATVTCHLNSGTPLAAGPNQVATTITINAMATSPGTVTQIVNCANVGVAAPLSDSSPANDSSCVTVSKPQSAPTGQKVDKQNCDPETTNEQDGKCVCKFEHMSQVEPAACYCDDGFEFSEGAGCFQKDKPKSTSTPRCGPNQHLENGQCEDDEAQLPPPVRPKLQCGKNQHIENGQCEDDTPPSKPVRSTPRCGKGQHLENGQCEDDAPPPRPKAEPRPKPEPKPKQEPKHCGKGEVMVKGNCISVPRCGPGQIPVPGTGACVSIGGGKGGGGRDKPRGEQAPGRSQQKGGGISVPGLKLPLPKF